MEKNPVRLSYKSNSDPISDEIDYGATHSRVIEILREIFPDPQNIIASVSRDRFVIFWKLESIEGEPLTAELDRAKELSKEIWEKLKDASIETIIGIGHPAQKIFMKCPLLTATFLGSGLRSRKIIHASGSLFL